MSEHTNIALIGPGAVGGTVAAWLAQSPELSVTLCARTPLDKLVVETPGGPIEAELEVLTDPALARPADWALVCTKAYDSAGAVAWLERLAGPRMLVAVLQNGVEHVARFAPYLPAERIVPAVVDIPAERAAPGRIRQRRDGSILVPASAHGAAFAALFAHSPIAVSTTADFTTAAWRKLAINCAGAVNALYLKPHEISREEGIAGFMYALAAECVAVGKAEGADLDGTVAEWVLDHYRGSPPDTINSIHADRLAGRPMEIDARNGVIVRLGAAHGIETPANALVVTLLGALQ